MENGLGGVVGASTIVRDRTWQKKARDALALVNKKPNMLNNITRNDILNQLIAI